MSVVTILLRRSCAHEYRRRDRQSRDAIQNRSEQATCHRHLSQLGWNVTYFACRVTFAPILISLNPHAIN